MTVILTYHKDNCSLHVIEIMAEIILTMHKPETSHWEQLAAKIKVDNTTIVVFFMVVEMFQGMRIE